MIILFLCALSLGTIHSSYLLNYTSSLGTSLHQICERQIPDTSPAAPSFGALVCGLDVTAPELRTQLLRTSLIHAYVVSGSHLLLLDEFLGSLKIPGFLRFLFLTFYALVAGWQPPIVRALLGRILRSSHHTFRLFIPADILVGITGMLCWALFPAWGTSKSFLLSWCAALALCGPSIHPAHSGYARLLLTQVYLFALMAVPLWGWGNLHPLGLLFNLLLLPYVALILLPSAVIAWIIPPSLVVFEFFEGAFRWVLQAVAEPVTLGSSSALPAGTLYFWIAAWHVGFHLIRVYRRQGYERLK